MKLSAGAFVLAMTVLTAQPKASRGELLYRGRIPLTAKLAASEDELAPAATRCSNCHGADGSGVTESEAKGSDIRGATLTTRKSRRGGPPSVYDFAAFLAALRDGQDPAHVILARAMPRYTISDADARAIWEYLRTLPPK